MAQEYGTLQGGSPAVEDLLKFAMPGANFMAERNIPAVNATPQSPPVGSGRSTQDLMAEASQVQPDLVPEQPEIPLWRQIVGSIFSGMGDSLSAYAGALGNFQADTGSLERLIKRLDEGRAARSQNRAETRRAEAASSKELARLELADRLKTNELQAEVRAAFDARMALVKRLQDSGYDIDEKDAATFALTGRIPTDQDPLGLKALGAAAALGAHGVTEQVPAPLRPAAEASAAAEQRKVQERVDLKRTAPGKAPPTPGSAAALKGSFAGFDSLAQLRQAVESQVQAELKNAETDQKVDFTGFGGLPDVRFVRRPTITLEEATQRALAKYPGAEKHLPGFAKSAKDRATLLEELKRRKAAAGGQ